MKNKDKHFPFLPAILSITFVGGLIVGSGINSFSVRNDAAWEENIDNEKALADAYNLIENNYYTEIDHKGIVDRAIYDMVDDLDPFSMYIPSHHSDYLQYSNTGKYIGIGIETLNIDGGSYINKVIKSGPASEAGIRPGSRIIQIDTVVLEEKGWGGEELSSYLRELNGDSVDIHVSPFHDGNVDQYRLLAAEVKVPNIEVSTFIDEVGYIKISKFGMDVYKEFMASLERLMQNDSLSNLIIDLRGNPGGYLNEVCKIISQLVPEKTNILNTIEGDGDSEAYQSTGQNFFTVSNIVILIDDNSASASEILAGVLQDLDRAVIMGMPSYGKGLVQEQFNLSNGGVLRLSISKYQLPSGRFLGQSDSLQYFSYKKERELSASGKIDPDIKIEPDTSYDQKQLFRDAIRHYAISSEIISENEIMGNPDIVELEKRYLFTGDEALLVEKLKRDQWIAQALEILENGDDYNIINVAKN